jgi:FixJ family two-component response regulator
VTSEKTVCIIDDDFSVRAAVTSLFRSLDFNVASFESGADFLSWLSNHSADCVISDVQMPGMSGVDMFLQMKTIGKHIPTIFITAYPTQELENRAITAGASAFFLKPVDVQELTGFVIKLTSSDRS